uniref:F-box domain-containing protein n=1 Tax=Rhabditophanes sp. KR3021 TaxID=114890 RepID=A0AC35TIR9_9BILA
MRQMNIIPNLPDVVLRQIFSYLLYKDLAICESICKRWQRIVLLVMKREIDEIVLEQVKVCKILVLHQPTLKRLSLSCPFDSTLFLTGIIRRSQNALNKITADLIFFNQIQSISLTNKEGRYKYLPTVQNVWLVITRCTGDDVLNFEKCQDRLFQKLHTLTFQVHVNVNHTKNVKKLLSLIMSLHHDLEINVELHGESSKAVFAQLEEFRGLRLCQLKMICTEFNRPTLQLTDMSEIMKSSDINCDRLVLRDWYIHTVPSTPLYSVNLNSIRLSSCTIGNSDALVSTLKATMDVSQLAKIEMVGLCVFVDISYLNNKAHLELKYKINCVMPDFIVEDDIYYA